jgi:hypothetical protein
VVVLVAIGVNQAGVLGGLLVAVALRIEWARLRPRRKPPAPPPPAGRAGRLRRRRPGHYAVTILDVRPGPEEPDPWIPYYAATCACGWVGTSFVTEEEARAEAAGHAPGVDPVIERPLA